MKIATDSGKTLSEIKLCNNLFRQLAGIASKTHKQLLDRDVLRKTFWLGGFK